jgi:CMP-N,N'-diacetyllegionaminic acid synthase
MFGPEVVIAFIPARVGSKGVVRKNLRRVGGKPLIAIAIETALGARTIDRTVVTTNCEDTAAIARSYGVELVWRPDALAADDTPTGPVIVHALEVLEQERKLRPGIVVLLQCTSPLRSADDVERALSLFAEPTVDCVTSVAQVGDEHPGRMYSIGHGRLQPLFPDWEQQRRQDLPPIYRRNGAIYAMRTQAFLREGSLIGHAAVPYIMPAERSVNIDTEVDLALAEAMLRSAVAS